jgi:hypothetical protein
MEKKMMKRKLLTVKEVEESGINVYLAGGPVWLVNGRAITIPYHRFESLQAAHEECAKRAKDGFALIMICYNEYATTEKLADGEVEIRGFFEDQAEIDKHRDIMLATLLRPGEKYEFIPRSS